MSFYKIVIRIFPILRLTSCLKDHSISDIATNYNATSMISQVDACALMIFNIIVPLTFFLLHNSPFNEIILKKLPGLYIDGLFLKKWKIKKLDYLQIFETVDFPAPIPPVIPISLDFIYLI